MSDDARRDGFGPNEWLIDEMFREFLARPESVNESWREFFSDYRPAPGRLAPEDILAATIPAPVPAPVAPPTHIVPADATPIVGPARRLAENMAASLGVPTATSVRTLAVKLLEENRALLNQHLAESGGGKVSFTHLVAWAAVKALQTLPALRTVYIESDGEPFWHLPANLNFGIAIDVQRKDGSRGLVVPAIKQAETMSFAEFFAAFNTLLRKAAKNHLMPDDFAGANVSLTNPGMLGTTHSVPRLMPGQSLILAAGAIGWPADFQYADERALAQLGVSKVMTLTCTYDHRVIQGAASATFLARIAALLSGEDSFFEEIFTALQAPHEPLRLARDVNPFLADRGADALVEKQANVLRLINMFRVRGHLVAHLNPLVDEVPTHLELELESYNLTVWDLDREFYTGGATGKNRATLREILGALRTAYCDTLAVEYMHIQEPDQRRFIQARLETGAAAVALSSDEQRRTLTMLNAAEAFERFLHTKYLGHKRFSLEGSESLIPMLDRLMSDAVASGVVETVLGMSHRGRLNVLANILGKSYGKIFREFEGNLDPASREGTGDVKYHLGAVGTYRAPSGGALQLTLASNPSHLEAVDPVVEGMARALQDALGDAAHDRVLPVLVHGDAAFAGQGVVAETFNMSALSGYRTGGTVHIVVNNGIGFTTAPADARSSVYPTDVAKMVQAPIFHVNGDDPEACIRVIDLALAFRNAFKKDVVVDVLGYRRWGHNESDEPAYTQPLMYARIQARRSVRKLYTERLVNRGDLSLAEAEEALRDFQNRLEEAFTATKETAPPDVCLLPDEQVVAAPPLVAPVVERATLDEVLARITTPPQGFSVHPKLTRQLGQRAEMLVTNTVDWGLGEALALGTLLKEGVPIRLSGQDSRRGTFSHRHAVLVDQVDERTWTPLEALASPEASFIPCDSLLSEYGVLGFEYGYSVMRPATLVLWEAQFGDFANGAQIIIDQFLAAAAEKWQQHSKLVLLLPHGHEGQGPEHSSARLERFLQLCAGDNLRVAMPTTAAQIFHLLRGQAHSGTSPLIVMTPKSLLRAPAARSRAVDFSSGGFATLLGNPDAPSQVQTLLLCSGKIAFDLIAARRAAGESQAEILRAEQLHPFPETEIAAFLAAHPEVRELRWVQEEPHNMGAWTHVAPLLALVAAGRPVTFVGRRAAGSPATGSARVHQAEQERLVAEALRPDVS